MSYLATYTNSRALVIGIDAYTRCSPLSNACHDAQSLADALVKRLSFPPENVRLLLNADATRAKILSAFMGLHEACSPDDRVIIFFAGHGHSVSGNTKVQGFLVPVDADPADLSSLIRWQEFVEGSEMIPAKHMLFVMDACFSGLLMQRAVGGGDARFVTDMLQRYSRQAITAGKADQLVGDGVQGGNSTFTRHFLEGLNGAAADRHGIITATSAMNYAYRRVSQDAASEQTPHYGHLAGDGDMVLTLPNNAQLTAATAGDYMAEEVSEVPEQIAPENITAAPLSFPRFASYEDAMSPNFGQNERTRKLVQTFYQADNRRDPATKFLAISFLPVGRLPTTPKLSQVVQRLRDQRNGTEEPPYWTLLFPDDMRTTLDTVLLSRTCYNTQLWEQFLCLDSRGGIEFAVADQVVNHWSPRQISTTDQESPVFAYWNYVALVGTLWSALELARRVYIELGYGAGVNVRVAVVGVGNGLFAGTSQMPGKDGKMWLSPLSGEGAAFGAFRNQICEDANILLTYRATQKDLGGVGARRIVDDFAEKFALAFNYQKEDLPCFNWGTRDFPWPQFRNRWRQ